MWGNSRPRTVVCSSERDSSTSLFVHGIMSFGWGMLCDGLFRIGCDDILFFLYVCSMKNHLDFLQLVYSFCT